MMEPLLKLPKPIWIVNHLNGRKEVFDEYPERRLHIFAKNLTK